MRLIDITGQRFGRLLVLAKCPPRPSKSGGSDWRCRCDCGREFVAISTNIRKGCTRSCGCLALEWAAGMGANPVFIAKRALKITTHGHKGNGRMSIDYAVWLGMKRRCQAPRSKDYPNWGGRGIRVCDRWNESFATFHADMGPRPSAQHSIDRLDPNGHYEPSNCRWATAEQQGGENKRANRPVTVDGVTFGSIAAAAKHFGVNASTAWSRIEAGIDPPVSVSHHDRLPSRRARESYLRKSARVI